MSVMEIMQSRVSGMSFAETIPNRLFPHRSTSLISKRWDSRKGSSWRMRQYSETRGSSSGGMNCDQWAFPSRSPGLYPRRRSTSPLERRMIPSLFRMTVADPVISKMVR